MFTMNASVVLDRYAAEVAADRSADKFEKLAAEGTISAPAAAFARQLNMMAGFFRALSVGAEAQAVNSL